MGTIESGENPCSQQLNAKKLSKRSIWRYLTRRMKKHSYLDIRTVMKILMKISPHFFTASAFNYLETMLTNLYSFNLSNLQ